MAASIRQSRRYARSVLDQIRDDRARKKLPPFQQSISIRLLSVGHRDAESSPLPYVQAASVQAMGALLRTHGLVAEEDGVIVLCKRFRIGVWPGTLIPQWLCKSAKIIVPTEPDIWGTPPDYGAIKLLGYIRTRHARHPMVKQDGKLYRPISALNPITDLVGYLER